MSTFKINFGTAFKIASDIFGPVSQYEPLPGPIYHGSQLTIHYQDPGTDPSIYKVPIFSYNLDENNQFVPVDYIPAVTMAYTSTSARLTCAVIPGLSTYYIMSGPVVAETLWYCGKIIRTWDDNSEMIIVQPIQRSVNLPTSDDILPLRIVEEPLIYYYIHINKVW